MANFTIIWEQQQVGGYSGRCLEIPGIISKRETLGELKVNMIDAITHAKSMHKEAQEKEMIIEVPA
jgi:predicted RNase H-like HicB family nuclease